MIKDDINILISLNSTYIMQATIMLESLFKNNYSNFNIYLIHSSLEGEELSIIRRICEKWDGEFKHNFIDIRINVEDLKMAPIKNHVSIEAYYRLLINDFLPKEVKRILYLDVDILINGSIIEMYNSTFNNEILFYGCEDKKISLDSTFHSRLNIPKQYKYINSGVLLINTELMREIVTTDDIYNYIKMNSENILYEDQDVINGMFYDKIKYLDSNLYNFIASLDVYKNEYKNFEKNAVIIHFAGALIYKPWNNRYIGKSYKLYYQYSKNTPYKKAIKSVGRINIVLKPIQICYVHIKQILKKILKL